MSSIIGIESARRIFTQVPEQSGHQAQAVSNNRGKQVFVRGMLRTPAIGVRDPYRRQTEKVAEGVVGERSAESGKKTGAFPVVRFSEDTAHSIQGSSGSMRVAG